MNLTSKEIEELRSRGVKMTADGKPYGIVKVPQTSEEVTLLRVISDRLGKLPAPVVEVAAAPAPNVVVNPAEVILKPITKWRFQIKRDQSGRTAEIIATAME